MTCNVSTPARSASRRFGLVWVCLALALFFAPPAGAQATDPVAAEELFQEARSLMQQGRFDAACPKFIESQRLDPATGTLIAIAICHERAGLLASAWAEFTEAAERASREGREDRVGMASQRADALRPRLSTLSVLVSPALAAMDGLEIRRGGALVAREAWNRAVPVDGGEHRVQASAPGYEPSEVRIEVPAERGAVSVQIPQLEPQSPPPAAASPSKAPVTAPVSPARAAATPERASSNSTAAKPGYSQGTIGGVLAIAGATSLTAAGYFLGGALRRKSLSNRYCDSARCHDADGARLLSEATAWGNTATVLAVGGALIGATGLTLYLMGSTEGEAEETGGSPAISGTRARASSSARPSMTLSISGASAALQGRF